MTRELKEHGLLFTAPMVRAILAGTNDVACDEGARIEIVDGWIVCRCGP